MSENFLGEIRMFGGNFAIKNWAFCNGQLLPIAQYSALFSLIGTTYGGDGRSTFALPNLQGRLPMGQGQGPGLSNRPIGQMSGSETVTVTLSELPQHSHTFSVTPADAQTSDVGPTVLPAKATFGSLPRLYATAGPAQNPPAPLAQQAVGLDGGSQSHSNLMPSLCVTFLIALTGVFPSRN